MSKLKIAIQKSGRLNEESLKILKDCGVSIDNSNELLKATASNFPLEVLFLRNPDIPQYLADGVVDAAIIGENTLIEKQLNIPVIEYLGFSKCRLSLAVPNNQKMESIKDFNGKRIATSYPNTLSEFLLKNNIKAELHEISGSVEIAPNIGLADAICDLVSSGNTLFKNGLKEAQIISRSEACIAVSPKINTDCEAILNKLLFRIRAVLKARKSKYILLNTPVEKIDAISKILPVLKSPTILPLAQEGWCSLHSVIDEDKFWEVIDQLKAAGAEGILIIPIEKMVL